MKARTRTTRWLLVALLFGILATAGLALTHHHRAATVAKANHAVVPKHAALQQPHPALLASTGGKPADRAFTRVGWAHERLNTRYSSDRQTGTSGRYIAPSSTSPGVGAHAPHGTVASNETSGPVVGSGAGLQPASPQLPPSNRPSAPDASGLLQGGGAGDFAYNGYAPLDCELPAGCGASGGTGYATRRPSGTSGAMPSVHDSQGSTPTGGGSVPQGNNGTPPTDSNSDPSNGNSNSSNGSSNPSNGNSNPSNGSSNPSNGDSSPPNPVTTSKTDSGNPPGDTGSGDGGQGSDPPPPPPPKIVASAPELDPATLGAAVTLLLGSLAVLGRRRVRATR